MKIPKLLSFITGRVIIQYITCLGFAILTYFFFTLIINIEEKSFSIPLIVKSDPKFVTTNVIPKTIQVTVRGNPASLRRVVPENIRGNVDFGVITSEGELSAPVVFERSGVLSQLQNVEILGSIRQIDAFFESKIVKSLTIKPAFINSLQRGYTLERFYAQPQSVRVRGPRSLLEEMTSIDTDNIDLSNITNSAMVNVDISGSNQFIEFLGDSTTRVGIIVEESTVADSFEGVRVIARGLREGLGVNIDDVTVTVILQGSTVSLEGYNPQVALNLSPYSLPGIYIVDLEIEQLPFNVELISIEPKSISVNINALLNENKGVPRVSEESLQNNTVQDDQNQTSDNEQDTTIPTLIPDDTTQ